jgi:hypothetical protein
VIVSCKSMSEGTAQYHLVHSDSVYRGPALNAPNGSHHSHSGGSIAVQEVNEDVVYSIRAQIPWAPSRVPDLPTAIVQGLLEVGSMSLVAPKHHQSIQGHIKSGIWGPNAVHE